MYSAAPFIWVITLFVVACFVISLMMGAVKSNRVLGLAALLWMLLGCRETFIVDPHMETRVDLLIILPVLLIVTVIGLVGWVKGWSRSA